MKTMRGILAATLPLLCSCGSPTVSGLDPLGSTSSPIEGGQTINVPSDPVSSLFPLSTVLLETPQADAAGNVGIFGCTGVILSPTSILTAAHCKTNSHTEVYLYPTGGGASLPNRSNPLFAVADPVVPVDVVCDPNASDWSDCYSNAPTKHFADLAILTLLTPVPAPYRRVILGPRGSYASGHGGSAWTVGVGMMNLFTWAHCDQNTPQASVQNDIRSMEWVASTLLSATDSDGSFQTIRLYTDFGDSGGPLYQAESSAAPVGADGYYLTLVGITSGGDCGASGSDTFTSTEYPDNFDWLVAHGGSASPLVNVEDPDQDGGLTIAPPDAGVTAIDGNDAGGGAGDSNGAAAIGTGLVTVHGDGCAMAPGPASSGAFGPVAALALLAVRRRRARRGAERRKGSAASSRA